MALEFHKNSSNYIHLFVSLRAIKTSTMGSVHYFKAVFRKMLQKSKNVDYVY